MTASATIRRGDKPVGAPAPSGFTLIEMLLATAMVAVLAGSLYASLRIAFKARATAVAATRDVRRSNLAMDLVQADLQSAVVPNGILAGSFIGCDSTESLIGSGTALLSFYATISPPEEQQPGGDLCKIDYVCQETPTAMHGGWGPLADGDSSGMTLERQVTRNLLAPQTPEPTREVVCRGLRLVALRYFDGAEWHDTWDSTTVGNILPAAVEILIEWQASGDRGPSASPATSRVVLLPCGQNGGSSSSSGGSSSGSSAGSSGGGRTSR